MNAEGNSVSKEEALGGISRILIYVLCKIKNDGWSPKQVVNALCESGVSREMAEVYVETARKIGKSNIGWTKLVSVFFVSVIFVIAVFVIILLAFG